MKKTALILSLLLILLLVACQDEGPDEAAVPEPTAAADTAVEEASPEATEGPTEEPAAEPTSEDTPAEQPTEEAAEAGDLPRLEPLEDCFVEMPEGADYECMVVEVPEFHNEDNGRSIKLGVIRLLSTADTPAEPLFFAEGGPGGSNLEQAALTAQNMVDGDEDVYTDLLSTRDLVFFSQRGTLYAEPSLMCSEETMAPILEAFSAGLPGQEQGQVRITAFKACMDEYAAAGVDFAAYNSVENAADINSIREVLGYDQIILYGDSYGTVLSQHVMRDFPDTLAAVILDGVDTLSAPSWVTQLDADFQSPLNYVIELCAADEACSEAYPNLAQDVEAVYQKLQSEPYRFDQDGTQYFMDENLAATAFYNALYLPFGASIIPLAVDSLLNDKPDEKLNDALQTLFFSDRPRFEGISFPMHYAMVCSEDPVTSVDDARSLDEVYSVVSEAIRSDASDYIEMCSYLNLPVLPDETDIPISSDLPVLLLSGAFDPATPPYNAEEVLATLPNGFSFEFPYGGHVQFSDDPCADSIVASFIADPTTEPDSSCIAEALPLPFALPAAELEESGVEEGEPTTSTPDEQLELMAAIAPPPQLSDRELGVHPGPCLPGVSPGDNLVEGEDYTCGTFTVPQNWEEPDGRNLDLAFVVVKATGENPEPDPLLFLNGGPGESAILSVDTTIKKYQELQPERDVILFDTRGLGLSQRLGFEECLVLALQNDAPAEQIAALQVAAPNLLAKASGEQPGAAPTPEELDFPVLNEICWEQFTAQGLDLNQFSTAAYARDAVELIKALGYESFNIDSVSYGTRHAMTIMNNIPSYDDAPQLRSVVLDSTFPPSVYLIRTIVRADHDFLLQLLAECQADAACNEAYPNLSERLATLLNGLEEAPLEVNGETVTLEDVVEQLRDAGEQRAAYLPKMIAELEMGVLDTYLALRDGEVGTGPVEALPATMEAEDLDLNDPVQAFVAAGLDLLSPDEASIFPTYIQFLMAEEDPLAALPEFIAETYTDETADQMLALSATLTAEDFANSSYGSQIQADAAAASDPEAQLVSMRKANAQGTARLLYSSIHCIDDILNESFEDAVNSYNSLAFPQLTNLRQVASIC